MWGVGAAARGVRAAFECSLCSPAGRCAHWTPSPQGSKVKVAMSFSGRELRFKDQGKELMLVRACGCLGLRLCGLDCASSRLDVLARHVGRGGGWQLGRQRMQQQCRQLAQARWVSCGAHVCIAACSLWDEQRVAPSPTHLRVPMPLQRFVEDLTAVGKVDGAINFKTSTFSCTMAPIK